jgi:hypothetical protein
MVQVALQVIRFRSSAQQFGTAEPQVPESVQPTQRTQSQIDTSQVHTPLERPQQTSGKAQPDNSPVPTGQWNVNCGTSSDLQVVRSSVPNASRAVAESPSEIALAEQAIQPAQARAHGNAILPM